MTKTLILVRHGHRDTTRRELDNGLTDKGKEQAKAIRRFFLERYGSQEFKKGLWLVSSPKVRCMETLAPLAKALERSVDAHPDLDEQGKKEAPVGLEGRVQHFLHEWARSQIPLTVLCSHGDWLPIAIHQLLGFKQEPKKGSWLELDWTSGRSELRWYVPSFKCFYT